MRFLSEIIVKVKAYGPKYTILFGAEELLRLVYFQAFRKSYSHGQEDLHVEKLLGDTPKFYVDVGAYLPFKFNNTYRFYKQGSRGINIEPNPKTFAVLNSSRKGDTNLNIGISDEPGTLTLFGTQLCVNDTFDIEVAKKAEKIFNINTVPKFDVEIKTLAQVFDEHVNDKQIDFLTIDAEGYDLKVLKSNNWKKYKPLAICVETNLDHSDSEGIKDLLTDLGYKLKAKTKQNSIFVLNDKVM